MCECVCVQGICRENPQKQMFLRANTYLKKRIDRYITMACCSGTARHTVAIVIIALLTWSPVTGDAPAKCGRGQADIVFILDSSGSIGYEDYGRQLKFAADLTGDFTIGDIQFSALIFSSSVENGFSFTTYKTIAELKEAILNLTYLGELTYTGDALRAARIFSFSTANGARVGVPHIAIVITDGLSTFVADTATEAYLLKSSGVLVIAIGVGSYADHDELQTIASSPDLVFTVDDYKVLDAIRSQIKENVCEELNNTFSKNDSCNLDNGCVGKQDGNYRACNPECERGFYYTCSHEYTYKMQCGFGNYKYPNGTDFTARKVFVQESDSCELETDYCPRVPQNYSEVPPNPGGNNSTVPTQSRPCLSSGDSCAGRQDGDYPRCHPECQDGYFISCSNNERYVMPCALGSYTDSNNNTYTARMVFDAASGHCLLTSSSCPRADPVPAGPPAAADPNSGGPGDPNTSSCIRNENDCVGKGTGDYRACTPECERGYYYTCSHNFGYRRQCAFGYYTYPNGTRYTARMVFVQESDRCQLDYPYCPRAPQNYSEVPSNPGAAPQCSGQADVLLILDSSASILQANYQVMKTFLAGLVKQFTVGPDNVQFSAIVFSDFASLLFRFSDYNSVDDVSKALLNATYEDGMTNTAAALRLARQVAFSAANGARENVGRILMLLTDGLSNNPNATAAEADLMRPLGILVIAVGVGPGADQRELQYIASSPSQVFEVDNFNVLGSVRSALVTTACNLNQSTTCITGSCSERADGNYPACHPTCQQGYYYSCSNQQAHKMPCALGWYKYPNGTRFTARLVYVPSSNTCELDAGYCPRDPQNFPVVPPTQSYNTTTKNGISQCINGSCVGKPNGNYPACDPDCKRGYYYSCSNERTYKMPCPIGWYTTAEGIRFEAPLVYNVVSDSCELEVESCPRDPFKHRVNPPVPYSPETQQCSGVADILIIIDSSGSINYTDYDLMKAFVARLTTNFTLGPRNVQFALIVFSSGAYIQFNFTRYTSTDDLYQAIVQTPYLGGGTDTAGALRLARLVSFTPEAGARDGVDKAAIVFTDGISNDAQLTAEESSLFKAFGVKVMSVGVGLNVDRTELLTIASASNLVFEVDNFNILDAISNALVTSACNSTKNPSSCVSNSCQGKPNGNYPACDPECKSGHFYSCSNELAYRMDCALAWYTFDNGTRFTARMVFNPTSNTCERQVDYCQRDPQDYVVPLPPPQPTPKFPNLNRPCLSGPEDCSGHPDGNYPMCYPECQKGFYYLCSNNVGHQMDCPITWYTDSNQNRFTARMVFDPSAETCQEETPSCPRQVTPRSQTTTTETPELVCQDLTDVLFILDSSASIGSDDYSRLVSFAAELTRHFTVGPDHVQVSALVFSSRAGIEFNFTAHLDNAGLYQAFLLLPYYQGLTDTASALRLARLVAFTPANGARAGSKRTAIVLTDGVSNNANETAIEAYLFKQTGVKVLSIGIGSNVDTHELLRIASSFSLVYNVTGYDVLTSIVKEVAITTCQTLPATSSTTSTTTTTTTTQPPSCVSGSCSNRPDGTYEACSPECIQGYYYVCRNGVAQQRTCDMVRYTENGQTYSAPGVYDPVAKACQSSSPSCPKNP